MAMKDEIDCRFELCNHVFKTVLNSYAKKDIYITWLCKRNIPLPDTFIEKALDFCKENEGLNDEEAAVLWQSLADRNLLPNAWERKADAYQTSYLTFVEELDVSLLSKYREKHFVLEKLSMNVDPVTKEFQYETIKVEIEQETKDKTFEISTLSMEQETKSKTEDFESQNTRHEQRKQVDFSFESDTVSIEQKQKDKTHEFETAQVSFNEEKTFEKTFSSENILVEQDNISKETEFVTETVSQEQQAKK